MRWTGLGGAADGVRADNGGVSRLGLENLGIIVGSLGLGEYQKDRVNAGNG